MKRGPEYSDSSRKKLVGELLRNADKLLKSGEYNEALAEVEKSLELEPGNFYAQAYKERISALREKHMKPGNRPAMPPTTPGTGTGLAADQVKPGQPAPPSPPGELTEATGAHIEELSGDEPQKGDEPAGRDIAVLKEQLNRERASHEDETARQAEELAKEALQNELRQREEADRLRAAEQQATQEALAGAAAEALAEVVRRSADDFTRFLAAGDLDAAFRSLTVIGIVDPGNAELGAMTARVDAAALAATPSVAAEVRTTPREIPLQWYAKLVRAAWSEGTPNGAQSAAVAEARKKFKVTPDEEKTLVTGTKKEIVLEALKEAYREGGPDVETREYLESLARQLSVGDLEALWASVSR
jgi:hypothetical protein